jgi:hypothetical protein
MTVGIAAICERDGEPCVVASADRMVTVGRQGGIEYEDTGSKTEIIELDTGLRAVAVGAGASTYIDRVHRQARSLLDSPDNNSPQTMDDLREYYLVALQTVVRETINNQVMEPFGYKIKDLRNEQVRIPAGIQQSIVEQVNGIQKEVQRAATILLAGVGNDGGAIYKLEGTDFSEFSDVGYAVVGSGSDSARLTFIRRRYDHRRDYREGVFTVLEAKSQAEERQGVGQQMDLYSVGMNEVREFDEDERRQLRQKLQKIEAEERDARESVMDEWSTNST